MLVKFAFAGAVEIRYSLHEASCNGAATCKIKQGGYCTVKVTRRIEMQKLLFCKIKLQIHLKCVYRSSLLFCSHSK